MIFVLTRSRPLMKVVETANTSHVTSCPNPNNSTNSHAQLGLVSAGAVVFQRCVSGTLFGDDGPLVCDCSTVG